jgi:hypothetical protein
MRVLKCIPVGKEGILYTTSEHLPTPQWLPEKSEYPIALRFGERAEGRFLGPVLTLFRKEHP